MKPNEGPLQTGEHILAKIVEDKVGKIRVGICRFTEENGQLEIHTKINLRELNIEGLQNDVNEVISQGLPVTKKVMTRAEAEKIVSLWKVPEDVTEIRVVSIGDFDVRPCRDPHVDNTKDIGHFVIDKVKKAGKDRYRYDFHVSS